MKRPVFGVGINDADYQVYIFDRTGKTPKIVWKCPYYRTWSSMLRRCYSDALHKKYPSYEDCKVCEEWKLFSNFKLWMQGQDWVEKQLDKDILVKGNKVYSPDTCAFVSKNLNCFFMENNHLRGEFPLGVSWKASSKKFQASCRNPFSHKGEHLGYFDNPDDAHNAWRKRKIKHINTYLEMDIDERVKVALRTLAKNL